VAGQRMMHQKDARVKLRRHLDLRCRIETGPTIVLSIDALVVGVDAPRMRRCRSAIHSTPLNFTFTLAASNSRTLRIACYGLMCTLLVQL
jgi:hypothetical protein